MDDVFTTIAKAGVVPVVKVEDAAQAVPLARALLRGGLPAVEITFRSAAAAEAIRRVAQECPGVTVGAGTVISPELARQAAQAGARFLVSPGLNPATVDWAREHGVPVVPGVATPTEVEAALMRGLSVLKLFPAEVLGGAALLDALRGPFPQVRFLPTGGITAATAAGYLRLPNVLAVGGTWMARDGLIRAGDWEAVARLSGEAAQAAREARE